MSLAKRDILLVRMTPDGPLDTSFGAGTGIARTDVAGNRDEGYALAVESSGRFIVAGFSVGATGPGNFDVQVVRYNPDGTVNLSRTLSLGAADSVARAMALQPDGKVLLTGCRATNRADHTACDLSLDLSSTVSTDIFIARLLASDLSFDTSFSSDGWDIYNGTPSGREFGRALVVDATGSTVNSIFVAGPSYDSGTGHFRSAVVRWNAIGAKDTVNFGPTGGRTFYHGGIESIPMGMALQDGLLVLSDAGYQAACGKYY
jgi:uncharacterized delta-60 repeat protein